MLKANSVLRAKSYGNFQKRNSNHLTFVLSKKGKKTQEKRINTRENKVSVKAGKTM